MPHNENQKKPFSISQVLEDSANTLTLLQGLQWMLPGLATLFLGLQLHSTTPAQRESATTQIHIHQEPGSQTIIQFHQVQNKLNQLNISEDKETLSKAIEAISELQQLIFEKKAELEQGKAQLFSQTDTLKLNTEQLQAKEELEKNIVRLQDETAKLNEIKQRIEASQEAIDWLDPDTKEEFLTALAEAAGDTALVAHPELKNPGGVATYPENIHQFYRDIEGFLFLIHGCLRVCRPNLLDRALAEKKLPTAPLPTSAYVTAFKFIRDQRVPDAISSQAAKEELIAYFNYLIKILS